jgi:hypothetical protein
MTPAEYKMAAEQMVELLHNGFGVVARHREWLRPYEAMAGRAGNANYELEGWLNAVSDIVNKWHKQGRYAPTSEPTPVRPSSDAILTEMRRIKSQRVCDVMTHAEYLEASVEAMFEAAAKALSATEAT